ncbi:integration host factor subunit alpha [Faucicola mancuniensis]|uniref:integration host factor subunit alpha n=1 Tax=Faucicola mancuniensis TaxID=1309795 RepID=UPI0028EF43E8|nr:integration host factor subunit alpha [uncultured Moraxella sp.]
MNNTTLTKSEMIQYLMDNQSMTRQEGRLFVESFFAVLSDHLAKGHQVKLSGFGNFDIKQKKQRPGRNPKTGEAIAVTARRVVTFKAGQKMRRRVEENLFSN